MAIDVVTITKWLVTTGAVWGVFKGVLEAKKLYDVHQQKAGQETQWKEDLDSHKQDCVSDRKGLHDRVSNIEGQIKR